MNVHFEAASRRPGHRARLAEVLRECACRSADAAACRPPLRKRRPLARRAGFHVADPEPRAALRRSKQHLAPTLARTKPRGFHIPAGRSQPRRERRAGTDCIEAVFEFETAFGRANGVVRLIEEDGAWRAWTAAHHARGAARLSRRPAARRERRREVFARLRGRELARPAPQGARLHRSRSHGPDRGRRPGRAVGARRGSTISASTR